MVVVGLEKDSRGVPSGGTLQFAESTGLELVVDDSDHLAIRQFFPPSRFGAGGSDFVAINGVTYSPSHQLWEIVYLRTHYAQRFRDSVADMRRAIDSVQAPIILSRPDFVGGRFQFDVAGTPGLSVTVQVSTNWVDWAVLKELTLEKTPVTVVDEMPAPASFRFYRVVERQ